MKTSLLEKDLVPKSHDEQISEPHSSATGRRLRTPAFYGNSRLFKLNQLFLRHPRSPRSTGRSREACQRNAALHVALIIICSRNYLQLPSSWLTVKLFIHRICWNVDNYRFYFLTPPSPKPSPHYGLHQPSSLKSLFKRFLQASGVCRRR